MKYLLILLFIPTFLSAQNKGDEKVVVKCNKSYSALKSILFDNGYYVENNDTSFIITTPKQMKNATVIRLAINRNSDSVIVKGQSKIQVEFMGIRNDFEPIIYHKSKLSMNYQWFKELVLIAGKIAN